MPPVYLVRHGQTVWNRDGRYQGQQDSPLTVKGIAQARAVGRLLAEVAGADLTMVASPLGRAWQTAVIVADCLGRDSADIALEPRLMEVAYGAWEGLTAAEVRARAPEAWAAREADKWNHPVPGGESYAQVAARLEDWLADLDGDGPVVAVGHGAAGRILRGLYLKAPPQEIFAMEEPQESFFRLHGGPLRRRSRRRLKKGCRFPTGGALRPVTGLLQS